MLYFLYVSANFLFFFLALLVFRTWSLQRRAEWSVGCFTSEKEGGARSYSWCLISDSGSGGGKSPYRDWGVEMSREAVNATVH